MSDQTAFFIGMQQNLFFSRRSPYPLNTDKLTRYRSYQRHNNIRGVYKKAFIMYCRFDPKY